MTENASCSPVGLWSVRLIRPCVGVHTTSCLDEVGQTDASLQPIFRADALFLTRRSMGTATHVVEGVGSATRRGVRSVGASTRFIGDTLSALRDLRTWPEQMMTQARRLGVESLRELKLLTADIRA